MTTPAQPDPAARRCTYEWWDVYTSPHTRYRCTKPEGHDGKHEALSVARAILGGSDG